jgi:hypothetical protein
VRVARLVAASREVRQIFLLGFGRNPYLITRRGFFLFTILKLRVASCEAQGGSCEALGGSYDVRAGRCEPRAGSCESRGARNIPFRVW